MKNLIFTFLLIPFLAFNNLGISKDFIGSWKVTTEDDLSVIIFDKEGYATFIIAGEVMGGKEFIKNGEKGQMTYHINMDAKPIEVDFTLTKTESGEQKTLLAIAEFIDADTLNFALSFDENRPTDFDGYTLVLTREKE